MKSRTRNGPGAKASSLALKYAESSNRDGCTPVVDPEESARRLGKPGDRIEGEDGAFRVRVAEAYKELAAAFPQRIITIDGTRPAGEIGRQVLDELRQLS